VDDFDPYREWLGITTDLRPPNHYELFGLPLLRAEPAEVAEAFRLRVACVTPHLTGKHGAVADRVLSELAAAKVELLTPTTKRMYDAALASPKRSPLPVAPLPIPLRPSLSSAATATYSGPGSSPSAAAQARSGSASAPSESLSAPVATQATAKRESKPGASESIDDWLPPAADPELASSYDPGALPAAAIPVDGHPQPIGHAIPIAAVPSPYGTHPPMAVGVPGVHFAAPMAAIPFVANSPIGYAQTSGPSIPGMPGAAVEVFDPFASTFPAASASPSATAANSAKSRATSPAGMVVVVTAAIALVAAGGFFAFRSSWEPLAAVPKEKDDAAVTKASSEKQHGRETKNDRDAQQKSKPRDATPEGQGATAEEPAGEPPPNETESATPAAYGPESDGQETAATSAMTDAEEPAMQSKPEPATPPAAEATPRQVTIVKEALTAARAALGKRNLEAAQEQLDVATLYAVTPELEKELSRVQLVVECVEQFWKAVSGGLTMLEATEEITVEGKVCAVVDSSADSLTVHMPGKNKEFKLREFPVSLAVTLAERWLDKADDRSLLVIGVFLMVDPKGDDERARRLFDQVAKSADAAVLIEELDAASATED
jgi:hypothetical protein